MPIFFFFFLEPSSELSSEGASHLVCSSIKLIIFMALFSPDRKINSIPTVCINDGAASYSTEFNALIFQVFFVSFPLFYFILFCFYFSLSASPTCHFMPCINAWRLYINPLRIRYDVAVPNCISPRVKYFAHVK